MYNQRNKKKIIRFSIVLLILSSLYLAFTNNNCLIKSKNCSNVEKEFEDNLILSQSNHILFEGYEQALNITDFGNLYKYNQEVSVNNQKEVNLTYYLDDTHDWRLSKIETNIKSVQDERDWINNSDFNPIDVYKVYQITESAHNYVQNRDRVSTLNTISQSGAIAMRVHFTEVSFEDGWDFFFIDNQNDVIEFTFTGLGYTNFYSPWIRGDELKCYYESDNSFQYYGYKIDFYEFVNSSSNYEVNSYSWGFNSNSTAETNYGSGYAGNETGMFVSLNGDIEYDPERASTTYYDSDFAELYQNITIPRGKVIDAYISFDYYAEYAMDSNENFLYCQVNDKKVYSKGFGDINEAGKNTWLSTGLINIALWSNTSNIFESILYNNEFNISVGIMSGATIIYTGFEDQYQQVFWFDNISLILTTLANSSQSDINLEFNNSPLNQKSHWGSSYLNITGYWNINPIILTVTSESPSLSFELNTSLYGFHDTKSRISQSGLEGVSYTILENGSINWKFYHNFYMPSQYSDFNFKIIKPLNWEIISILDPTLQPRSYTYGEIGDNILLINQTNAVFPGWWTIYATSPNYLNVTNTYMLKDEEWGHTIFSSGESTRIKTDINQDGETPSNIDSTIANLKIYDPEGNLWHEENKNPLSNGTVFFSEINFESSNTTGGIYNYTIFWSNGTALGGIKSNFIIKHNSELTLLKPDDPSGFVGDIFPVRVLLEDSENSLTISSSLISYNWTDGIRYFTEAALGIYETILDSADLASRGVYYIIISSSKTGFFNTNITLELNLGEETRLQRLESEYDIELHANSTLKFKFTDFDGDGIDGATVDVGISNSSLYSINNTGSGIYYIEFSTLYINNIGTYELSINFSAPAYQPQYHRFQFEITKQSVNLNVLINNVAIFENSLHSAVFYDNINVSTRAISRIDGKVISGGNVSWITGSYEQNIIEKLNFWYNGSISCSPEHFIFGINYVYLKFEHDNYKTQTFGFQVLVNQIELNVDFIGFEDTVNVDVGGTLMLQIRILDPKTTVFIENATVSFSWEYGVGYLEENSPGIYELNLKLPENLEGTFIFNLIVSKESAIYKTTQFSFFLVIGEPSFPVFIIWIIIISLIIGIGVLGTLSLRSYVILPRKRKKQSKLLSRTQKYKDMGNIQAIVVIHKLSGIPLFSKSYSILEKQKKELFSGFIQAITTIGEEIIGKKSDPENEELISRSDSVEKIIELDFKYFYCLICDRGDLRIVLVLQNRASDRLKEQVTNLSLGLMLQLSKQVENWDGSLDTFEQLIPPIMYNYFELYYKEAFVLNSVEYIAKVRNQTVLSKMETRILNIIYSMAKSKQEFYLEQILEIIHEEDKNKVIDGIESLLEKKIIISVKK